MIHDESHVLSTAQRCKDVMLGLNGTMDQLSMANSVHCYGHVLRREDGHVLRLVLSDVSRMRLKVMGGRGVSRTRKR